MFLAKININKSVYFYKDLIEFLVKNLGLTLKDKKVTKRIIGRNKDYIITMDNVLIPIRDIIDIKSKKK